MSRSVFKPREQRAVRSFGELLERPNGDEKEALDRAKSAVGRRSGSVMESLRAEGREQGYLEGLVLGREEGYRAARLEADATTAAALSEIAEAMQAQRDAVAAGIERWYADAEQALGCIAVLMAQRIVAKQLDLHPDTIAAIAREALHEVAPTGEARIKINPRFIPALRARLGELQIAAAHVKGIVIVEDEAIEGGCIVETGSSVVDAQIATKLRNLIEAAL